MYEWTSGAWQTSGYGGTNEPIGTLAHPGGENHRHRWHYTSNSSIGPHIGLMTVAGMDHCTPTNCTQPIRSREVRKVVATGEQTMRKKNIDRVKYDCSSRRHHLLHNCSQPLPWHIKGRGSDPDLGILELHQTQSNTPKPDTWEFLPLLLSL